MYLYIYIFIYYKYFIFDVANINRYENKKYIINS